MEKEIIEKLRLPIRAQRLHIREFNESMTRSVYLNSLDNDMRRFTADEVFETIEEAQEVIENFMQFYSRKDCPLVCPVILNDGKNIGYVQAVPIEEGWEIGYHIAEGHTGHGYATEAVKAFLPVVMDWLGAKEIYGICHYDNYASIKVLEKCGFKLVFKGVAWLQGTMQEMRRYKYTLK